MKYTHTKANHMDNGILCVICHMFSSVVLFTCVESTVSALEQLSWVSMENSVHCAMQQSNRLRSEQYLVFVHNRIQW